MRTLVLLTALLWLAPVAARADRPPLVDGPVAWYEDDRRDIEEPEERDPNLLRDIVHTSTTRPLKRHTSPANVGRMVRSAFGGDRWPPAANVNALDEALNSSWFTNRIGLYDLTAQECARGPGDGDGPDRSGAWTVVGAKTEGVTPGFNIRDASGDVYVIKFDPPGQLYSTTAPGVIVGRLLHAAGYNVPDDAVVTFTRDRLVLGDDVKIRTLDGKRPMTTEDLDAILQRVQPLEDGRWLAIASKYLSGKPVGPFDYKGRRDDDPNDRIDHEDRRELRGLRLFCAWLNHFDTKQHNTLDMYVEEDGKRFVKHHLIDFASTLGSGASGPAPKYGWEYGLDAPAIFGRLLTLGLVETDWRTHSRPEGTPAIGYFDTKNLSVKSFEPLTPNTAFALATDRDFYWAAKILSAFSDEHLAGVVEAAGYGNPEAADYVTRTLSARRDVLVREVFEDHCPVDFFRVEDDRLIGRNLGVERGLDAPGSVLHRVRSWPVNADRDAGADRPGWTETEEPAAALGTGPDSHPFQAVEFQVRRDGKWSPSVIAYVARASGSVVGVDR